jgi:hypothetical protein
MFMVAINDQITDAVTQFLHVVAAVGFFRYFIYAIGEPHAEYNPKAVLAWYPFQLALIRVKQLNMLDKMLIEQAPSLEGRILNEEMRMTYYVDRIKPLAKWANAFGFCPICTSFWVMLFAVGLPLGIVWFGVSLLLTKIVFKWT